jgi:hypothetical protein
MWGNYSPCVEECSSPVVQEIWADSLVRYVLTDSEGYSWDGRSQVFEDRDDKLGSRKAAILLFGIYNWNGKGALKLTSIQYQNQCIVNQSINQCICIYLCKISVIKITHACKMKEIETETPILLTHRQEHS